MGPVTLEGLGEGALLLVDSAPIIYTLEDHPRDAARFRPIFEAHAAGSVRFAVSPVGGIPTRLALNARRAA